MKTAQMHWMLLEIFLLLFGPCQWAALSDVARSGPALAGNAAANPVVIHFPSPLPSGHPANDTVWCWWYRAPAAPPRPGVIVLHAWRTTTAGFARDLCHDINASGMDALLVALPYHLQRALPGRHSGDGMITGNVGQIKASVEQAVADVAAAARWLRRQPEIDPQRVGIAGVSLGAIIAPLVMERDPDVKAGAFLLGGGDFGDLLWYSLALRPFRQALIRQGYTRKALRSALADIDPCTAATTCRGRPLLMINGYHDYIVPRICTERLWRALGKPELLWLGEGHYGAAIEEGWAFRRATDFLHAALVSGHAASVPSPPYRVPKLAIVSLRRGGIRPAAMFEVMPLAPRGRVAVDVGMAPGRLLTGLSVDTFWAGGNGLADIGFGIGWGCGGLRSTYTALALHF